MAEPDQPARRIFTVPPGVPFLDALATAILTGQLPGSAGGVAPDPLDLPTYTILLPTRRATRAMQEAFLRAAQTIELTRGLGAKVKIPSAHSLGAGSALSLGAGSAHFSGAGSALSLGAGSAHFSGAGSALLLPRIRPIAETLEDAGLLGGLAEAGSGASAAHDLPPAISDIERRLVLTSLVRAWSAAMRAPGASDGDDGRPVAGGDSPAQALRMASELARLMDMVETEGVDLARLETIVPDDYSEHWQQTLDFLKIIVQHWPAHLAERGLLSPADRRNRTLRAEADRIAADTAGGPIIVAGVTGSIPATVDVMRAVLGRANGQIVLPGVDHDLDAESYAAVLPSMGTGGHPEHPQFGLAMLLRRLGLDRDAVRPLPGLARSARATRARLISEALRPASTTDRWRHFAANTHAADVHAALDGVSLVEAATESEEAEVVALVLRHAVETPSQTVALVSPDRRLARRVAARLQGLGIEVDDSAGRPFAKTETGSLLDLAIAAIDTDFKPATVLALLKHPLTRLGLSARERGFATRSLELGVFRTLYLGRGLDGIAAGLARTEADVATRAERFPRAIMRLKPADWARARDLVERLRSAYAPLTALYGDGAAQPVATFAAAHAEAATALAAVPTDEHSGSDDGTGSELWAGPDGETGATLFAALGEPSVPSLPLQSGDYADVYRSLIGQETIRPVGNTHPRVSIWGPFEARMQCPDVVVLGSLNNGTWPEAADPGPWLNRTMRATLGLPSPEETLGYAAHDMSMLLGAPRVIMTRALKVDNSPTVASRWLLRLTALLDSVAAADALRSPDPWLAWARAREVIPTDRRPAVPPAPKPEHALRPRRMSVSDVETWIANPYAIFARRVLELEALPPVGRVPDASLRGSVLHAALAEFTRRHPRALPADASGELIMITRDILQTYTGDARVAAFWVPRFDRFCRWFAETEPARRTGIAETIAEISGLLSVPGLAEPFMLTARADRVDISDNGLILTDYKTGGVPNKKRVESGAAPQLPLEAAIAEHAGLGELPPARTMRLVYIKATGGDPPAVVSDAANGDIAGLAATTLDRLTALIRAYDQPTQPYTALRRPGFRYDFDDYDHLARVQEWLAADVEGDGNGDAGSAGYDGEPGTTDSEAGG